MRRRTAVFAALLLLSLTGCAGTSFEWDNARQVKIGTTEAELTALLGKPYLVKTQGDAQVWVWSYASGISGTRVVSFSLKDGKVTAVPNLSPFN